MDTPLEEALKIMGAPDSYGSSKMKYGNSLLLIGSGEDGNMAVLGWENAGELKLASGVVPQDNQSDWVTQ